MSRYYTEVNVDFKIMFTAQNKDLLALLTFFYDFPPENEIEKQQAVNDNHGENAPEPEDKNEEESTVDNEDDNVNKDNN